MSFPSSNNATSLAVVLSTMQALCGQTKSQAQSALATMAAQSVDTNFVFQTLDRPNWLISTLTAWQGTAGLNAYATADLPGYTGTLTTDTTAVIDAPQACIDWVVANFPKDSTNSYILAESINSNGTRTLRQFTPAQTAGFRTTIQALIATNG